MDATTDGIRASMITRIDEKAPSLEIAAIQVKISLGIPGRKFIRNKKTLRFFLSFSIAAERIFSGEINSPTSFVPYFFPSRKIISVPIRDPAMHHSAPHQVPNA